MLAACCTTCALSCAAAPSAASCAYAPRRRPRPPRPVGQCIHRARDRAACAPCTRRREAVAARGSKTRDGRASVRPPPPPRPASTAKVPLRQLARCRPARRAHDLLGDAVGLLLFAIARPTRELRPESRSSARAGPPPPAQCRAALLVSEDGRGLARASPRRALVPTGRLRLSSVHQGDIEFPRDEGGLSVVRDVAT